MQRKNMIILMISLSLVLLLGSSYALLRSTQVGSNPYVINVGNLQVTFDSGKTEKLSLDNMYPMSDKEGMSQTDELGFIVMNTGTVASYYDITLEETSTNPEFKSVIRFISNKDSKGYNEPKTLSEDKYIEVGGYLESNKSSSYKVKVWLDYNATEDYMDKTFTAKVVVNSFQESSYAKDVIKSKLVKYSESSKEDFSGGLVAVNTDGDLYNEIEDNQEIREYRYSGPTVNNYVTFNDELWRILGVFKEGHDEFIKIVRNDNLPYNVLPNTFLKNNIEYTIKTDDSGKVYWNNNSVSEVADWTTAGIQYYLNNENDDRNSKGYLYYLTNDAKNMIRETKYYLGNVEYYYDSTPLWRGVNTIVTYNNERENIICDSSIIEFSDTKKCSIWYGNKATWIGKVGLLYPSDYGYAATSNWWHTELVPNKYNTANANKSNWIALSIVEQILSISPSSRGKGFYISLNPSDIMDHHTKNSYLNLKPTLHLKSNVKIDGGLGTLDSPYTLKME